MAPILITISLIAVLSLVFWYNRRKEQQLGKPTEIDKRKSLLVFSLSLLVLLVTFYVAVSVYVVIVVISAIIYQVIGIGSTEHGWYRQIRDGYFVGFIVSIPICWYMYELQT
tara:strand:+ start:779 stop:1114 length:336 start_codon:yes stop_codon:yes gene_type:complete